MSNNSITVNLDSEGDVVGNDFKRKLQSSDSGRLDSLRRVILNMVTDERYERAIEELQNYTNYKTDFPEFAVRSERHIRHCIDLVRAIKAKRSFPGMKQLSAAKQKELHDTALAHFDELTYYLKQIEKVEVDLKLVDVRSTTWFIQTVFYSCLSIAVLGLIMDFMTGFGSGGIIYFDDLLSRMTYWFLSLF